MRNAERNTIRITFIVAMLVISKRAGGKEYSMPVNAKSFSNITPETSPDKWII